MRMRFSILIVCIFFVCVASAQKTLIGLTRGDVGHVIEYDFVNENLFTPVATTGHALPWYNDLIQASNGTLYGMTESGGAYDKGTIFSYDPASNTFSPLLSFGAAATGPVSPFGSLLEIDGMLYGMTESGGANGKGTIFSFDPVSKALVVLHDFDGIKGRSPFGSLIKGSDGKLYGVTESGGTHDFGTVFSYDIENDLHIVLHHFELIDSKPSNGRSPYGSLIEVNGSFYGTAQFGGTHGYGVVFSVTPGETPVFNKRAEFNWTNGAWPNSTLVKVGEVLYGTTESGGPNTSTEHIGLSSYGVIYSFNSTTNAITNVFNFSSNQDNGRSPYGKLTLAANNKLYGMTFRGGTDDKGVLYAFNPTGDVFEKKIDFTGSNGMNPAASLVEYDPLLALPLTLVSFSAREDGNNVKLLWNVERESEIEKYEIERSTDGATYASLGFVNALNTQSLHQYSFTDRQPAGGNNYYRLKVHEQLRASHYSAIRVVKIGRGSFRATVQPNPVSTNARLHISLSAKSKVQVKLYNALGVLVKQWPDVVYEKGEHDIPLRLTGVTYGSYMLVVEAGAEKQTLQLIKGNSN